MHNLVPKVIARLTFWILGVWVPVGMDAGSRCSSAIERDLKAGMTIIADRYAFSGIAFSAAKVSHPPGSTYPTPPLRS